MAPRAKNEPFNEGADGDGKLRSWPDLPKKLINVLAWKIDLMQDINYGGVTKSWRAQPRQCNNSPAIPLRLELDDIRNNDRNYKFSISFHRGEWRWPGRRTWQEPWKHCVGYSDGLLVAKAGPVEGFYLDYCTKLHWGGCRSLPPWDPNIPFQRAVVYSLPPNSWGHCEISIMVLTGISHPAFVFPRLKEGENYIYEWIRQDCTIADPHCTSSKSDKRNFMRFTNAIGHKRKFYALSLQGTLTVIEDINSHLRITALGRKPALPSVSSRHFRERILESNGEILLVFLISCNSINIVDDVEVFKLDIGTLSWVKMHKLGDRTLILGSNCSMSVSGSKLGCRRDCVYFSHHRDTVECWWVYNFERGNISPCQSEEILPSNYTIKIERKRFKRIKYPINIDVDVDVQE